MVSKIISTDGPGGTKKGAIIVTPNSEETDETYPFPYTVSMTVEGNPYQAEGDDPTLEDYYTVDEVLAGVVVAEKKVRKEITRLSQIPPELSVEEVLREQGFS